MKKKNLEQEQKYADYVIKMEQENSNQYQKVLRECLADEHKRKENTIKK
jgi:hypothetical protein